MQALGIVIFKALWAFTDILDLGRSQGSVSMLDALSLRHASNMGRLLGLFGGAHAEGRLARAQNRLARAQNRLARAHNGPTWAPPQSAISLGVRPMPARSVYLYIFAYTNILI